MKGSRKKKNFEVIINFEITCPKCGHTECFSEINCDYLDDWVVICSKCGIDIVSEIRKEPITPMINPPLNPFPSNTKGQSGETVYWAPEGSKNPVYEDFMDSAKLQKMFDKTLLGWEFLTCHVDEELCEKAHKSKKCLEQVKKEAYKDNAIPFVSISSMPLNESYFSDNYCFCYFASRPFKLDDGSYATVGVIGP
jgi:hypothetical protein